MKLTLNLLNRLFKPFNITIQRKNYCFDDHNHYYILYPFKSFLHVPYRKSIHYAYIFNNLAEVFDSIVQATDIELKNGSHVKNPYFNCNSLEEMFIKKDLLHGNN